MNTTKEIKRVINIQIDSLKAAQSYIGPTFEKAVNMIYSCRGKVVITGIGKSGLVAQKIASTFSSTGTPAIYLHPVEGVHGNVGVVQKSDVVLAIGKSGESEELLNLIPSLKKIGVKIIGFTANQHSSLAKLSSLVLWIPVKEEACPYNLAPTTSSTLSLVIGDALAIALMKKRGFTREKFALYHPGGLLGKRLLLKVSDVMRSGRRNPVVGINETMKQLLLEISRKWTGAASVVDKSGRLVGLVTDYDIRMAFARGDSLSKLAIRNLMNPKPTFIYSDQMAIQALEIMESRKKPLTILPVVDRKRRSVGMIHLHDLVAKGLLREPEALF